MNSSHLEPGNSSMRRVEAPTGMPWQGAPLAYHEDFFTPQDLIAACTRYAAEYGVDAFVESSHMWRFPSYVRMWEEGGVKPRVERDGHSLWLFIANRRCAQTRPHQCPTMPYDRVWQAICPGCAWHVFGGSRVLVAEAWHDHAMPGWRDLPIVPLEISRIKDERSRNQELQAWLVTHYPENWRRTGSPIIQYSAEGTRACVPAPYQGYRFSRVAASKVRTRADRARASLAAREGESC